MLPLGGFTGQVPFPSTARCRRLVGSGRLTYVVLSGIRRGTGGASTATGRITAWVESSCHHIPAAAYGVTISTTAWRRPRFHPAARPPGPPAPGATGAPLIPVRR